MEYVIGILGSIFIVLISLLIRQSNKIGVLESTLKNENKTIDGLIAKIEALDKKSEEFSSSISEIHDDELKKLHQEIKVLNEKLENKNDFQVPPTVHHW